MEVSGYRDIGVSGHQKMASKGVTARVYEQTFENIRKRSKTV